jgi:hypothetical protein
MTTNTTPSPISDFRATLTTRSLATYGTTPSYSDPFYFEVLPVVTDATSASVGF